MTLHQSDRRVIAEELLQTRGANDIREQHREQRDPVLALELFNPLPLLVV